MPKEKDYSKLISLAENGLIRAENVYAAGIKRYDLLCAVKDGVIENITDGIYFLKSELEDKMYTFQLKHSKLIFSAYTSAYLLGLTTLDSEAYSVSAPSNYNPKLPKIHNVVREKKEVYELGWLKPDVITMFGNSVKIFPPKETIFLQNAF